MWLAATDPTTWFVGGGLGLSLMGVGRLLWIWEKTFVATARVDLAASRAENIELRAHVAKCESETAQLRIEVDELRAEVRALKRQK